MVLAAMRAVLRADASAQIGFGHLSRSLTLARGLRARGFETVIATRAPSEHVRAWIAREQCAVAVIEGDEIAASCAAAAGADLVVVDGYAFGPRLHDALRAPASVVCVLDDEARQAVHGDIVLNGNVHAERLVYDVPDGTELLLGPRFALVRDEFVVRRGAPEPDAHDGPPRILITMGGADPPDATSIALRALDDVTPADVRIVVGAANPRAERIARDAAARRRHHVEVLVDVNDMAGVIGWSDVVVTAAGSTCLEIACIGRAAVCLAIAGNQEPIAAELDRRGMALSAGTLDGEPAARVAAAARALLADSARRRAMCEVQADVVDGLGKDRAAEALQAACARRRG